MARRSPIRVESEYREVNALTPNPTAPPGTYDPRLAPGVGATVPIGDFGSWDARADVVNGLPRPERPRVDPQKGHRRQP